MERRPNVTHEWGVLKEVVVGRVTDFVFPEYSPELAEAMAFLPEQTKRAAPEWSGHRWSHVQPEGFARCVSQVEGLVTFLKDRGIEVHRPRVLTEREDSVFDGGAPIAPQIFVRDPMIVIGHTVIETALRPAYRFRERYGLRPVFAELQARGADYRVMPPPSPLPVAQMWDLTGPILEGSDVFVMGADVLVGVSQGRSASNGEGVDWLRATLGDRYRVHEVPLSADVLHMDDGLAIVDQGLALVCREQFPDGLPALLDGWDIIDVSLYEAMNLLAGNGIVLGPREIVIDERVPHLVDVLSKHDVIVHTLPYDAVTQWAGGFRCSHQAIVRELR